MKYESRSERSIAVDDTVIEFPTKIQAAVALDDRIVVLLNNAYWSETDPERARNVYCYGTGGKLLWRIEAPGTVWRENGVVQSYYSYLGIDYDEASDQLKAETIFWNYVIDKDTGAKLDGRPRER